MCYGAQMRLTFHRHPISTRFDRRPRLSHPGHFLRTITRRGKGKDLDLGGVPVEPDRPGTLSGGAAAALEFDD